MTKPHAMKAIVLSGLLTVATAAFAKDKIVGGEPVTDLSEIPYMASLSGSCGASIIASKWLLTAAHCVGYFTSVKVGVLNLNQTGISLKIKRSIKHPKYNPSTFSNDVALVELEDAIDFKRNNLKPVKLAGPKFEQHGHQDPGVDSTVYGFGNIGQFSSNTKKTLNKVVVPVVSLDEANASHAYNGAVDETMLPAGYAGGGKDSCQGDSGGPMVIFDHQNEPVQVGVVSWGHGCARPNKYGVYSKVSHVYEWIMKTIKSRN